VEFDVLGKSLVVRRLCEKHGIQLNTIEPSLVFLEKGSSKAQALRKQMSRLVLEPRVILLKRVEEILPKKTENGALEAEMLYWMQSLNPRSLFIMTTTLPKEDLHPIFRHIIYELELPPKLGAEDKKYLAVLLGSSKEVSGDVDFGEFCDIALNGQRQERNTLKSHGIPPVQWNQVVGHEQVKLFLKEALINDQPRGILLHGPPGSGKTMLAQALVTHISASWHFINVTLPNIVHAEIGGSEKAVQRIFKEAVERAPSLIFFDEFDSMMDERIVRQLSIELDRLQYDLPDKRVLLLATTNRLESIHVSLRRSGRFGSQFHITQRN